MEMLGLTEKRNRSVLTALCFLPQRVIANRSVPICESEGKCERIGNRMLGCINKVSERRDETTLRSHLKADHPKLSKDWQQKAGK